jgi:SAM-dependent methyltransferase
VLEIGCGDGELAAALQQRRCSVVAIDCDPRAVTAARRRGVDARRAHWPDFCDGLFDAVLFTRSLHHVGNLKRAVAHALRQLRPGGRVLVEDFDFAAADAKTAMWLHGVASGLLAAGAMTATQPFVAVLLGRKAPLQAWRKGHDDVHGHEAIRRVLAATGLPLRETSTEYLFRYLEPTAKGVQERVRRAEAKLIAAGALVPLGRRFVLG